MAKKLLFLIVFAVIMFIFYQLLRFIYLNISPHIHSWRGFFDSMTVAIYFLGCIPLAGNIAQKLINQPTD